MTDPYAPDAGYDTAERRDRLQVDLQERGIDHQTVAARVRGDVTQAQPATAIQRETARAQTIDPQHLTARDRQRLQDAQLQSARSGLER
jgi:hypothetical protein